MNPTSTPRGPSSTPRRASSSTFRGRANGRGRGSPFSSGNHASSSDPSRRGTSKSTSRGSTGRGSRGSSRNTTHQPSSRPRMPVLPYKIAPEAIKPHNPDKIVARREKLKEQYNELREKAIADGLMSSEDQSSIDSAIKTKGICTQMCDEKERVERMFNGSVAPEEQLPHPETGHLVPIEGRMVKAFRRSAAGTDRQIPEELRTAKTCWKTMHYLFDHVMGSDDRLGRHHKFVWDRTRAIRNDFTIQGFTKPEDVKYEVACYEGIIRFHILSLHQLSDTTQIYSNGEYSRQQEIAQLKATFASLLDRYNTFSQTMQFRNEAEFRAYYALFSARTDAFDADVVIQTWPKHVLDDGRVQTALKLHTAAATSDVPVGSYKLESATPSIAQNNTGLYWSLLASQQVGYLMACTAEISFQIVRFTALNALWRSAKAASKVAQTAMRGWTREILTEYLGFDNIEQTVEFCRSCEVDFAQHGASIYLDFTSNSAPSLDQPRYDPTDVKSQIFSHDIVEQKRHGRTFTAILQGKSIAEAQRLGMISKQVDPPKSVLKNNSMFVGDDHDEEDDVKGNTRESDSAKTLNPSATSFFPTVATPEPQPWRSNFGSRVSDPASSDGPPPGLFGQKKIKQDQEVSAGPQSPFSGLNTPQTETKKDTFAPAVSATPPPQSPFSSINKPQSQPSGEIPAKLSASSLFEYLKDKPEVKVSDTAEPEVEPTPEPSIYFGQKSLLTHEPPAIVKGKLVEDKPLDPPDPNKFAFLATPKWGAGLSTPAPALPTFGQSLTTENTHKATEAKPFNFGAFNFGANQPKVTSQSTSQPAMQGVSTASSPQPSQSNFLNAAPVVPPSAVPQPTAPEQRPKLPQFASLSEVGNSTTPEGSPVRQNLPSGTFTPISILKPSLAPVTKASAQPPFQQPVQTLKPVIDKEQLLHQLCRLGLVQRDGVLDMFINLRVSQIVQDVFKKFQNQKLEEKIFVLKEKVLQRKYFALWSSIAAKRRLRRKAERRRTKLAATLRAEKEKKTLENRDMAQILEAEREKRNIQEEQQRMKEEEMQRKQNETKETQQMKPPRSLPPQQAGQKRKTLTHSTSRSNIQDISMSPMHKRSRTIGTGLQQSSNLRALSPASSRQSSSGHTDLRRSVSQRSLRQPALSERVDTTKTDYFRLKAAGLDPETPLIPHTAATLAMKKQNDADHFAQRLEQITRRPSSRFAASQSSRTSTPAIQPEQSISPAPVPPATTSQESLNFDEDPFLKSMREAREALGSDVDWFKSQTEELEKEVEAIEEFRRSRDSTASQTEIHPLTLSVNGFARSQSGYEYVPSILQPGQTLSRTEERIRRTGAHGLANKPIGGTPGHSPLPDYAPVAMSKRSASALMQGNSTTSLPSTNGNTHDHGKKRDFDAIVATENLTENSIPVHYAVTEQEIPIQISKRLKNAPTFEELSKLQETAAAATATAEYDEEYYDDEEDEEEEEGDEDEEEEDLNQAHQPRFNGIIKGGLYQNEEDYYDEDEEEEDEEEEGEEGAEEESDLNTDDEAALNLPEPIPVSAHGNHYFNDVSADAYGYEEEYEDDDVDDRSRSGSRLSLPRQDSRAMSAATPDTGVGSTLDDAIELSD